MSDPKPETPIIVMGVSGAGKSSVAEQLARRISGTYIDADDLHSAEAKVKMASGQALIDSDRVPWLERVGREAATVLGQGQRPVIACSALRRAFRTVLIAHSGRTMLFVHLDGAYKTLFHRLDTRADHFMPPSLLSSQLATLEPLGDDENGFRVAIEGSISEIVDAIVLRL